jgi:hypothetical protein
MYGSRTRGVPPQASTAACDSAGTSGSPAVRWQKFAQTIPVEIQAWRIFVHSVAKLPKPKLSVARRSNQRMGFPASQAVVRIAQFENFIVEGERAGR